MREQIEAKMAALQRELEQADQELSKLRPRVQYLETVLQRCDGALVILTQLLKEEQAATVLAVPTGNTHQESTPVPEGA